MGAWQIGQIMQARVVKQAGPQTLLLQVNNQRLLAESNVALSAGQRLELTVAQLGDKPVLQARLLSPVATGASQAQGGQSAAPLPGRSGEVPVTQAGLPPNPSPKPAPQASLQLAANILLKQALSRQSSMAGLLANIAALNSDAARSTPLPPAVEAIVKQLYANLPSAARIEQAQQLKQAVNNSGVFLENKLNQAVRGKPDMDMTRALQQSLQGPGDKPSAVSVGGVDLKATLTRLLGAIQQVSRGAAAQGSPAQPGTSATQTPPLPFAPPPLRGQAPQPQARAEASVQQLASLPLLLAELSQQGEAALSRIQLHQAASLPAAEPTANSWALELPIRHGGQVDLFDMVIEEETSQQQGDDDHGHPWSVTLAFDLNGLGPVYAKLRLNQDKVSTLFWAEHDETVRLFNQHLDELLQRYRDHGLETAELRCFQGPPPGAPGRNAPHVVLDVKA